MSISKGGQSVKPYVGSKEVKEAYVGSQLVYKAVPPYIYRFLGNENDYIIDGTLLNGASVAKEEGIFRISNGYRGSFQFANVEGQSLKFLAKFIYSNSKLRIEGVNGTSVKLIKYVNVTTQFTLIDCGVINGYARINITQEPSSGNNYSWVDAVRFEPV